MNIPAAFLDEVRGRTDLPALVGRTVKLQRAGREWKGCCPFHGEKTPSFYVYADHYHCFGCGAHGDAIRWLTDQQGLPFPEAVRELAAAAGLEVPQASPEARARAERAATLRDAVEAAAGWFAEQLWGADGGDARAYLERRGVTKETARAWGLGYAPDARGRLRRALAKLTDPLLTEAGLLVAPEGGGEPYDRFRGRLMFPIRDARGRAIGFGGRALGDGQPKYLNSPDTPLFDKGRTLWNLDRAGPAARAKGRLFVVEGYMDVLALAQAGIAEAVAPMGTALTEAQLALAWRLVPEPTLTFDGDAAGARAAAKAAERALPGLAPGRSLRFVALPGGRDPDNVVREGGAAAFEALATRAEPLNEALWRGAVAAADASTPEGRAGLKAALLARAAEIGDREVRTQYEALFRERFWTEYGWRKPGAASPWPAAPARHVPRRIEEGARAVVAGLLAQPDLASDMADAVAALPCSAPRVRRVRDAVVDAVTWEPAIDAAGLAARLAMEGLAEDARWVADGARRYRFNAPGADAAPAREQLRVLLDGLAALEGNHRARLDAHRAMRAAGGAGDPESLQKVAAPLSHRLALLARERQAIHDRLTQHGQDAASQPHLAPKKTMPGIEDGEDQRGDDRARGDPERGPRRAADRP